MKEPEPQKDHKDGKEEKEGKENEGEEDEEEKEEKEEDNDEEDEGEGPEEASSQTSKAEPRPGKKHGAPGWTFCSVWNSFEWQVRRGGCTRRLPMVGVRLTKRSH